MDYGEILELQIKLLVGMQELIGNIDEHISISAEIRALVGLLLEIDKSSKTEATEQLSPLF